jgi:hypothetical protein
MLYAIHSGFVEGYARGQAEIVHLVSSAEAVDDAGLPWVFSDGHAEMAPLTDFYDDLKDLDKIDWEIMNSRYWHDTNDDPDRKRRRQAEFLVHDFFPWNLVSCVGVLDQTIGGHVQEILRSSGHKPDIQVQRPWYYS